MNPNEEILKIISTISKVPEKELELQTDIFESNIVTSLGLLEIIASLEKEFEIFIMPEELIHDNFGTIEKIYSFVHKKMNKG